MRFSFIFLRCSCACNNMSDKFFSSILSFSKNVIVGLILSLVLLGSLNASAQTVPQSVTNNGANGENGESVPVLGYGTDGDSGDNGGGASYTSSTVNITATSVDDAGVFVQSNGGNGGKGGNGPGIAGDGGDGANAGDGGTASVNVSGAIQTSGNSVSGIIAQSLGGNGGNGGDGKGLAGIGGDSGSGGDGGAVTVSFSGTITTTGNSAHGILAESNAGNGGNGGDGGGLDGEGGDGGTGGNGGNVTVSVTSGSIDTSGIFAHGIFAQSRGGVGGDGGGGEGLHGAGGSGAGTGPGGTVMVTNGANITTADDSSYGILAQSVGGFGGSGGSSGGIVGYGASGKSAGPGGNVQVTNTGTIQTQGDDAHGLFAQSVGGGGGAGGSGAGIVGLGAEGGVGGAGGTVTVVNSGNITTEGVNSIGLLAQSVGGGGGDGGDSGGLVSIGGDGSGTTTGGTVSVTNSGNIVTGDDNSHAILAQSIGGGGGNGGASGGIVSIGGSGGSGGTGGDVSLTNTGNLTTSGDDAVALFGQSVGGGGGNGGGSIAVGAFVSVGVGGSGGSGGDAGNVILNGNNTANTADATIMTSGDRSHGILGQSVGGGGGNGGYATSVAVGSSFAASVAVGGSGGAGGDGGDVYVGSNGTISTIGDDAIGVFAQSVGGGGGNGGTSVAIAASTGASLSVSVGGAGGAAGTGGTVDVNSYTDITTTGDRSHGILAQSIGGGGGNGGFSVSGAIGSTYSGGVGIGGAAGDGSTSDDVSVNSVGNISTQGTYAHSIFAQSVGGGGGSGGSTVAVGLGATAGVGVGIGGSGGTGQNAGDVTITSQGNLSTNDTGSHGILAQSIGGGGGNGGFAVAVGGSTGGAGLSVGVGGSGDSGGNAGEVSVTHTGNVSTTGDLASGVYGQSVGGGGGDGGFGIGAAGGQFAASVAVGGSGSGGGTGDDVTVNVVSGTITTVGSKSRGIFAQSVGGGGGDGGFAVSASVAVSKDTTGSIAVAVGGAGGSGSTAGAVNVTSGASISTQGIDSHGIQAQSVGGGGGNGGFAGSLAANFSDGVSVSVAVGGAGGPGTSSDSVTVTSNGQTIQTQGDSAHGIFAQSVGGGGGDAGFGAALSVGTGEKSLAASVAIGGGGGAGGHSDTVDITNLSNITTSGDKAHGILGQSIGGGGGNGGLSVAGTFGIGDGSAGVPVAVGGAGGNGNYADDVTVSNEGNIVTTGVTSKGIYAQSIGGGGGDGGLSVAGTINLGNQPKNIAVSVGGGGGDGSSGGDVDVTNSGNITTSGEDAQGILAQSIGGGGGEGGFAFSGAIGAQQAMNLTVAVGGTGGNGSIGGTVDVDNSGTIHTTGDGAHGIQAQSIGGGGGNGGSAGAYGAALTADNKYTLQASVAVGGSAGDGNVGGDVTVLNSAGITTEGDNAYAILAQSIGGGGGDGGTSYTGNLVGDFANDGKQISVAVAVGGSGGTGNHGGEVEVDNDGNLVTSGDHSNAIYAHSIGGGGGDGGGANAVNVVFSPDNFNPYKAKDNNTPDFKSWTVEVAVGGSGGVGGDGGDVEVDNSGAITTSGDYSAGIYAQSIGAGGGDGGTGAFGSGDPTGYTDAAIAIATCLPCNLPNIVGLTDISIVVGGNAGAQGDGGNVLVENSGNIQTSGTTSHGILAQSIGGGGGTAYFYGEDSTGEATGYGGTAAIGPNGKLGVAGAGGAAGDGGNVTVTNTAGINTSGRGSHAIIAQSIGGGGGIAGDVDRTLPSFIGAGAEVIGIGNIGLGLGFGQDGGDGGDGGLVTVTNSGAIVTTGSTSYGIFAQSVGGGGGISGNLGIGPNFAGSVGNRGDAGNVVVTHSGTISTSGNASHGIFAQSAGGNSSGSSNGTGGSVDVTVNGSVNVSGEQAIAVLAQSIGQDGNGNISITVGSGVSVIGGSGTLAENANFSGIVVDSDEGQSIGETSAGIVFFDGATNTLDNSGVISVQNGIAGMAIGATGGDETINNAGTITGSVDLAGGTNAINNNTGGTLNAGSILNLGDDAFLLTNDGTLSPGATGTLQTTGLTGSIVQNSGGSYAVDLDFGLTGVGQETDLVNASGSAELSGSVDLGYLNIPLIKPGDHESLILHADDGVTNNGLTLNAVTSAIAQFQLLYPNPNDVVLGYQVDFSPENGVLNPNQIAIGDHINDIQTAGSDPSLSPLIIALFYLPTEEDLADAYDELSPETYAGTQVTTLFAGLSFADSMMKDCKASYDKNGKQRTGKCVWLRGQRRLLDRDTTANHIGADEENTLISGGAQFVLSRNWQLGIAAGYELSSLETATQDLTKGKRAHGGLHVKYQKGATELSAAVSGGYGWHETQRLIQFPMFSEVAQSEHNIGYINGRLRAAYTFKQGSLYVKPAVDLNITQINLEGFVETGAGGVNLNVQGQTSTVFSVSPSVEVGGDIVLESGLVIKPYVRGGVTVFEDNKLDVNASFAGAPAGVGNFNVNSEFDQVVADVEAGVKFVGTDDMSLSLDYKGRFGENTEEHSGSIRAKVKF